MQNFDQTFQIKSSSPHRVLMTAILFILVSNLTFLYVHANGRVRVLSNSGLKVQKKNLFINPYSNISLFQNSYLQCYEHKNNLGHNSSLLILGKLKPRSVFENILFLVMKKPFYSPKSCCQVCKKIQSANCKKN